jgi:hypothetical protein
MSTVNGATAVEITISVVDTNSGDVISKVKKNISDIGTAGKAAGQGAAAGMDQISKHSLTALDNVRLLRDDLGIRIPRSMEKAIASSKTLMAGIGALGQGLLAVGAIDIGIRIAEGLKKGYDEYLSLTAAAKAYAAEVDKARHQDFIDSHSIETTIARIDEATEAIRKYTNEAEKASSHQLRDWAAVLGGAQLALLNPASLSATYKGVKNLMAGKDSADKAIDAQKQLDGLQDREREQTHERNLEQIEVNHALDGELRGRQKINAELAQHTAINAENRRYETEREGALGNATSGQSGASEEALKDQKAQREAQVQTFNLNREQMQELQRMRAEAAEAGLKGEALYAQQERDAIAALKGTDKDTIDYRNSIHAKFHAEEMARLRDEATETARIQREAATAGLTGIAKTQAEGAARVGDIAGDANLSPAARAARIAAAQQTTNAQILEEQRQFSEEVDAISDASAQHQVSGFARIRADASRQLDQLERKFETTYGQIDVFAPGGAEKYAAGYADLQRGRAGIGADGDQQTAELARRNAEETEQIEAQARAKLLSGEKQQTAAIETEYEERVRKYKEQLDQQEISQDDFNRRVVAAGEEMQAQMVEQARQAREKIAGELSAIIGAHPLEGLQKLGEKFASQAGAALIQRAAAHFGGLPNPESAIDKIAGIPGVRGGSASTAASRAGGMMTIAHAEIQIGSASIAGGGGGYAGTAGAHAVGFGGAGSTTSGGWGGGLFSGSTAGGGGGFGGGGFGGGDFGGGPAASVLSGTPGALSFGAPGGGFSSAIGGIKQGVGAAQDLTSLFSSGAGGGSSAAAVLAKAKLPSGLETGAATGTDGGGSIGGGSSAFGQSMLGGGMTASNTLGAAGAGLGLFSAFKTGGFGGALSGAMSGGQLGMEVGGPIGAAIGAVGGAVLGFFGGGEQARVWWLKQGRPRLANDVDSFEHGGMDYLSAYMDMEQLKTEAHQTLSKMGFVGSRYYHDTVTGEIGQEEAKLSREQKAGRSAATFSSAEYDVGTDSVPRDGMAVIHEGERIMPSDQNERITRAIEAQSTMPVMSGAAASEVNLHFHSPDAKGARDLLMQHSDAVRAALTKSYGDYGGQADWS